MKFFFNVGVGVLIISIVLTGWNCTGGGSNNPNVPPITRLVNVPPSNFFSENPRLSLSWVGDDPDGFVVGFRYRWTYQLDPNGPVLYKPWFTLINFDGATLVKNSQENYALMTDAVPALVPEVFRYFAVIPNDPNDASYINFNSTILPVLKRGDTVLVLGAKVWASNSDSIHNPLHPEDPTSKTPNRYPVHVNPKSGTFIFDSPNESNPHSFEIEAIDNSGEADEHRDGSSSIRDYVVFSTGRVDPPIPQFDQTQSSRTPDDPAKPVFVSDKITDTFTGIAFIVEGFDPNSRTVEYSYTLDRYTWLQDSGYVKWSQFSEATTLLVDASQLPPSRKYAEDHTIYLRARNEFGVITPDSLIDSAHFYTVFPEFVKDPSYHKILFLNCSYSYGGSTNPVYPSRETLEDYYISIFEANGKRLGIDYDTLSVKDEYSFPSKKLMANYSSIFLSADVINFETQSTRTDINDEYIKSYCSVGGKMVITGHTLGLQKRAGEFMSFVCHLKDNKSIEDTLFGGATGHRNYPNATLDPAKWDLSWFQGFTFIWTGIKYSFAEVLYTFHSVDPDSCRYDYNPTECLPLEGRPIGTRYIGPTYSVIYFGFPLYYIEKNTVQTMLSKAFQDIGE